MINYKNKLKGFTIIELIVVIAIIAVLATVVVSYVNDYNRKAKIAATQTQLGEIAKAVLLYKANVGCYPDPETCSGEDCWCLGEVAFNGFNKNIGLKKSSEIGLNNILKKISELVATPVYASDDCNSLVCVDEGGVNGICTCSEEEGINNCIGEGTSCVILPTYQGEGTEFISVLVSKGYLGGGNLVNADAWGNPYNFAFNIFGQCSFVYSFGVNGQEEINEDATSCGNYFEGDDIYILISNNE